MIFQLFKKLLLKTPHFVTCFRQLKMLFATILVSTVANNIFNCLKQIIKWGFSFDVGIQFEFFFEFLKFYNSTFKKYECFFNVRN